MISLITNEYIEYLVIILSLIQPHFLQIRDNFSNLFSIASGINKSKSSLLNRIIGPKY